MIWGLYCQLFFEPITNLLHTCICDHPPQTQCEDAKPYSKMWLNKPNKIQWETKACQAFTKYNTSICSLSNVDFDLIKLWNIKIASLHCFIVYGHIKSWHQFLPL